jgi:hypothetical protein
VHSDRHNCQKNLILHKPTSPHFWEIGGVGNAVKSKLGAKESSVMSIFKKCVLLFFKDKLLTVISFLFFTGMLFVQIYGMLYSTDALSQLRYSLEMSIYCFICLAFISNEYIAKVKLLHLEETVAAARPGIDKLQLFQIAVLGLFSAIISLVFLGFNTAACLLYEAGTEYLWHIAKSVFVNIFLVSIVGTLLGTACALLFKRLKAYLILAIFILLTSPIFNSIVFTVFDTTGLNLYPVFTFFNIYSPALNWSPNYSFGFSLLPYRYAQLVLWISLFLFVIFLARSRRGRLHKIIASICILSLAMSTIGYFSPSSKVIMNNDPVQSLRADYLYYQNHEQKSVPAQFEVNSYDLQIRIGNQLFVTAKMQLNTSLPEYQFTLYRGYKIKKITDPNGSPLPFLQDGDYFTVTCNQPVESFTVTYHGYSPKFYSNTQGVCLPGFFPYYPQAGYHPIFSAESQGYERVLLPNQTQFHVAVTSRQTIYSNLESAETNLFVGTTTGMTLYSGFLKELKTQDVTVIYPYLNTRELTAALIKNDADVFLSSDLAQTAPRKILVLPNLNLAHEGTTIFSDHITARAINNLTENYILAQINPRKIEMYQLIQTYLYDPAGFAEFIAYEQTLPAEFEDARVSIALAEQMEALGRDAVLRAADQYIRDDTDTRTTIEFLRTLH